MNEKSASMISVGDYVRDSVIFNKFTLAYRCVIVHIFHCYICVRFTHFETKRKIYNFLSWYSVRCVKFGISTYFSKEPEIKHNRPTSNTQIR